MEVTHLALPSLLERRKLWQRERWAAGGGKAVIRWSGSAVRTLILLLVSLHLRK